MPPLRRPAWREGERVLPRVRRDGHRRMGYGLAQWVAGCGHPLARRRPLHRPARRRRLTAPRPAGAGLTVAPDHAPLPPETRAWRDTRRERPMFIEQRIYTAHPGKLPAWLKCYAEIGGPASSRTLTPQIGMFTVEFGQINRVLFLRGFDDIDQRERGLAARDADPEWQRFLQETRPIGALMA